MALLINRGIILLVVVVMAAAELVGNASAATYVVGDSLGWRVPPGGAGDYATWASQHTFRVGDILVFNFPTGQHDVAEVGQGAYDACTSTNPITLATLGPASLTLNSSGPNFYICTFGQHCSLGQKLTINVTSSSSTPPTPAPLPPTIMPPSPAPALSPPTVMPTPVTSPSASPSPSGPPSSTSAPSPAPSGAVTPASPASEASPASGPSPSSSTVGDLTPPPSSATTTTIRGPIIVFALIIFGLAI